MLLGFEQANRYTIYDQHGSPRGHTRGCCWAPVLPRLAATWHTALATKPSPSPAAHLLSLHLLPVCLSPATCAQATLWRCWLRIWAPSGARWAGSCCAPAAPSPPPCSAPTVSCLLPAPLRRCCLLPAAAAAGMLRLPDSRHSLSVTPRCVLCLHQHHRVYCRMYCCRPGHLHSAAPHVSH